jgi:hypothetical protein
LIDLTIDLAIEHTHCVVEPVAEQFFTVNHHAFIARRHQLVDQRPLHRRHETILNQLFVT